MFLQPVTGASSTTTDRAETPDPSQLSRNEKISSLLQQLETFAKLQLQYTKSPKEIVRAFRKQTIHDKRVVSRLDCIEFVKKIKLFDELLPHINPLNIENFPVNFDQNFPISQIKNREYILESICNETETVLIIGEEADIWTPMDESEGREKQAQFMEWLITRLNNGLKARPSLPADVQTKLMVYGVFSPQARKEIDVFLVELFEKYQPIPENLPFLMKAIQAQNNTIFVEWANKNLALLLSRENRPSANYVATEFEQDYWLETCVQKIPCFRILQGFAFSTSDFVSAKFNEKLIPLNDSQVFSFPFSTKYEIAIHSNKAFTVEQSKHCELAVKDNEDPIPCGSLVCSWSLRGSPNSALFSANLCCKNIQLSESLPVDTRLEILRKFGLNLSEFEIRV